MKYFQSFTRKVVSTYNVHFSVSVKHFFYMIFFIYSKKMLSQSDSNRMSDQLSTGFRIQVSFESAQHTQTTLYGLWMFSSKFFSLSLYLHILDHFFSTSHPHAHPCRRKTLKAGKHCLAWLYMPSSQRNACVGFIHDPVQHEQSAALAQLAIGWWWWRRESPA